MYKSYFNLDLKKPCRHTITHKHIMHIYDTSRKIGTLTGYFMILGHTNHCYAPLYLRLPTESDNPIKQSHSTMYISIKAFIMVAIALTFG